MVQIFQPIRKPIGISDAELLRSAHQVFAETPGTLDPAAAAAAGTADHSSPNLDKKKVGKNIRALKYST